MPKGRILTGQAIFSVIKFSGRKIAPTITYDKSNKGNLTYIKDLLLYIYIGNLREM